MAGGKRDGGPDQGGNDIEHGASAVFVLAGLVLLAIGIGWVVETLGKIG